MRQFSIRRTAAAGLQLSLLEDGEEVGGGGSPDTPEDREFLEDQAYEWGATEEVSADGGGNAQPTP